MVNKCLFIILFYIIRALNYEQMMSFADYNKVNRVLILVTFWKMLIKSKTKLAHSHMFSFL